jgi:hypothetical protein
VELVGGVGEGGLSGRGQAEAGALAGDDTSEDLVERAGEQAERGGADELAAGGGVRGGPGRGARGPSQKKGCPRGGTQPGGDALGWAGSAGRPAARRPPRAPARDTSWWRPRALSKPTGTGTDRHEAEIQPRAGMRQEARKRFL